MGKPPSGVLCPAQPRRRAALRSFSDGYSGALGSLIEWDEASLCSFDILLVSVLTMTLQSADMLWMFTEWFAEKQPVSVPPEDPLWCLIPQPTLHTRHGASSLPCLHAPLWPKVETVWWWEAGYRHRPSIHRNCLLATALSLEAHLSQLPRLHP